jgi:hypothetical protein
MSSRTGLWTDSLVLNTGSGLFTDPALRATAREAMDGSALVDSVFSGYADPAQVESQTKGKVLRLAA